MRKIDQNYLETLKDKFNLIEVIREAVPSLRAIGGGEYKGRCPFHEEDTASFTVNKYRYHCFGCHKHGDLFSWVKEWTGKTFPQVVKYLARGEIPFVAEQSKQSIKTETAYDAELIQQIYEINAAAQSYFTSPKEADNNAIDYMIKRFGIDRMPWEDFGLGYAGAQVNGLIEALTQQGYSIELMHKAGLIAQDMRSNWYDRLRDRITIPLYDSSYNIRGFTGRIVPREINSKIPKYMDPNQTWAFEKKRYLYGLHKFKPELKYAILVEGPLDAIACYRAGLENVLAIMGCHLSQSQVDILETITPRVFVLMDGDLPGLTGTFEATKYAHNAKFNGWTVLMSDGLDPEEWLKVVEESSSNPLRSLPIVKFFDYYTDNVVIRDMKPEYDRSKLDELIKPYVLDNIRSGFPHYNVVDWVMQAYPHYAAEIKAATLKMVQDTEDLGDGKVGLKEDNIKEFIKVWIKPSREVRKLHANQFKSKRS